MTINFKEHAQEIHDELIEIRRWFHMHPELSFEEVETGKKIAEILRNQGIEVKEQVGKTGLVGILKGGKPGKVVGLRADIDALPITEINEVSYKSTVEGKMHACGHDSHMTSLIGAAMLLSKVRDQIPGTVKFIFEPAEEINQGAKAMIADGALKHPDVDAIYGLHNSPNIDAEKVGVKEGPLMAAVDTIKIKIHGESGHGAVPHKARDAIVAASSVVMNLQTIVSRKISAFETAVVSIGTFHGGKANNVISESVEMTGTCRTYNPEVRKQLPDLMRNIVEKICEAHHTTGDLEYEFTLPAVMNEEKTASIGKKAVAKIVGEEGVVMPELTGGGEDFALYQEKVPGTFYFLGVRNEEEGIVNEWHSQNFNIDERALWVGAGIYAQSAFDFLNEG
jgi:amidohydrolase